MVLIRAEGGSPIYTTSTPIPTSNTRGMPFWIRKGVLHYRIHLVHGTWSVKEEARLQALYVVAHLMRRRTAAVTLLLYCTVQVQYIFDSGSVRSVAAAGRTS